MSERAFEQPSEPTSNLEKPKHELIEGYHDFEKRLKENAERTTPERVAAGIRYLEEQARTPDRKIGLYTDPSLDTFCCMQVPAKQVTEAGEIILDSKRQEYLIGVPYKYIAGQASTSFMQGEILHEQGHALWTDFNMLMAARQRIQDEGGNVQLFQSLLNCVEDPRMERMVGGPLNKGQRSMLFAKNKQMIVPNLAQAVTVRDMEGEKIVSAPSLTQQFLFLMKVERLWEIHQDDWKGIEKPWSEEELDPRVLNAYRTVEPALARITGDSRQPCLKVTSEVYRLVFDEIWPVVQELDEESKQEEKEKSSDQSEGDGTENQQGEPKPEGDDKNGQEQNGNGMPNSECEHPLLNPRTPDKWPEPMRQIAQKMLQNHQVRLEKESEEKKELHKLRQQLTQDETARHNDFLSKKDGFENPADREEYEKMAKEVYPITQQIGRIFDRYLPKVTEPQHESNRRGTRFNMRNLLRKYGTGQEQPMERREKPEEAALVLQILVDVSSSMAGDRILNAVKACLAICEASANRPISIEVLASDHRNIGSAQAGERESEAGDYLIKDFSDKYDVKAKLNLLKMLNGTNKSKPFGGGNDDSAAVDAAVPRIRKKRQQVRVDSDRMASLMVFITDSTTQDAGTRESVGQARKVTSVEGTAIDSDPEIGEMVRYHFGEQSSVPPDLESFPGVFAELIKRHVAVLRRKG